MLHLDFETYSEADLSKVGARVYAEHPSTEILLAAWATDDSEPRIWWPWDPIPQEWREHSIAAWNAPFEKAIIEHVLPRHTGETFQPPRWLCVMAQALSRSLPGRLEKAADVLGLDEAKDAAGRRIMLRLAKPCRPTKKNPRTRPNGTREDFDRLASYCLQDVRTERAVLAAIGKPKQRRQGEWECTERMNARGVLIDAESARGAIKILGDLQRRHAKRLAEITGGEVKSGTQLPALKRWLDAQGYAMASLTAQNIDAAMADPAVPEPVRAALRERQHLSAASATKFEAMLRARCADGRARNLIQDHGATTGRDAGRLYQPQNLPRPSPDAEDWTQEDIGAFMDVVRRGDLDTLEAQYGDAKVALKNALRPIQMAAPGHVYDAADLAGIENRVLPALAGETWKLEAFREIDADPTARDMYCRAADTVFGFTVTKKEHPEERFVGKVLELAMGFQGGVGAWRKFDPSDKHTDDDVDRYKLAWRQRHPATVNFWYTVERAMLRAVTSGKTQEACGLQFGVVEGWAFIRLLSGRCIWYRNARAEMGTGWNGDLKPEVVYDAWRMGQWRKVHVYGGLLTENIVQATARDLLMTAHATAEKEGHPIVLRVHDELVSEPTQENSNLAGLIEIMVHRPQWAVEIGLPMAASGWTGPRYWK